MGSGDGGLREPAVAGVRLQGDTTVVTLQGELDLHNVADVREALTTDGPVVADLGAVEFIDSTVIGALVEARKQHGLRIAAAGPLVLRALHVAGVDSYLQVFESVDAALA